MSFNIAIDGPAGAGKSTIAKAVAEKLGFIYVDTGAMYRAIALYLLRHGVDPDREEELEKALEEIEIRLQYDNGVQQILLNGENVSSLIRTEEVSQMASVSSAKAKVRSALLDLQRNMAAEYDVIMDGRDIGTAILPNARLKIFLTASSQARANRRFLEYQEKGIACDFETIKAEIEERDRRDTQREVSPLRQAADAVLLDTSDMTIEEVTDSILSMVKERRG